MVSVPIKNQSSDPRTSSVGISKGGRRSSAESGDRFNGDEYDALHLGRIGVRPGLVYWSVPRR